MMDYVGERMPAELREQFAELGQAHVVRTLGIRLAEAMERGMPSSEAVRWLGAMVKRLGWKTLRDWPWQPFLVKAALPSGMIQVARAARNRVRRPGRRR
jgi:hypothetical protein